MGSDERADFFNLVGEDRREALLRRMARHEREEASSAWRATRRAPPGRLMTSDYVAIPAGLTVSQAMMRVRQTAPDAETVYQLYILDGDGRLASAPCRCAS